jgi:ABC-type sugar transport system permease subunit
MAFQDSKGNFSFVNFQRLWTEFQLPTSTLRIALRNTLITFVISLACFIPRVLVSYFIYKKVPGYRIYRILFFLPSILFSVCVAMCFTRMVGTTGFIAEFVKNVLGLDRTPELLADSRFANFTIWFNMLWLGFPGDLIIWGGTFARLPGDVLESARLDGVNWFSEFTKIVVPMVWPTVALKMVLTVCGILGATGQVYLLTKGNYGTMTLSAWLYRTLIESSGTKYTSNVYNYLSAVGIVMTVISVAIALVVRKYTDKAFQDVDY